MHAWGKMKYDGNGYGIFNQHQSIFSTHANKTLLTINNLSSIQHFTFVGRLVEFLPESSLDHWLDFTGLESNWQQFHMIVIINLFLFQITLKGLSYFKIHNETYMLTWQTIFSHRISIYFVAMGFIIHMNDDIILF